MAEQFPDQPSPEIAAERARILEIIARWQLAPNTAGASSRLFTAIKQGFTLEQLAEKNWGHPWS